MSTLCMASMVAGNRSESNEVCDISVKRDPDDGSSNWCRGAEEEMR